MSNVKQNYVFSESLRHSCNRSMRGLRPVRVRRNDLILVTHVPYRTIGTEHHVSIRDTSSVARLFAVGRTLSLLKLQGAWAIRGKV